MAQSTAQRMKCYRARREAGLASFHLVLDEVAVAEMLIGGGLLSERDAEDRDKLTAALQQQIAILIEHSRHT